jgi:hypothetical protein
LGQSVQISVENGPTLEVPHALLFFTVPKNPKIASPAEKTLVRSQSEKHEPHTAQNSVPEKSLPPRMPRIDECKPSDQNISTVAQKFMNILIAFFIN